MDKNSRIYIAGHTGLVGSALVQQLNESGHAGLIVRTRAEVDLTQQASVEAFFESQRPEFVFLAAAKVGGILANNTYPAEFIRDNLLIQTFILDAARRHGVRKILVLGSSCIYPKLAQQPMKEDQLMTGLLEPTNEYYAIAKIAAIKLAQALRRQYGFNAISVMPTNLYGPGDNFDLNNSHVLPAMIRKFHDAKSMGNGTVVLWGTGEPKREFLHVQDLAQACVFLMREYDSEEIINVGVGEDISIRDLAQCVSDVVGFHGEITFDSSKPDGAPRKLLDVSKLSAMGWSPRISLRDGIASTYEWFLNNEAES